MKNTYVAPETEIIILSEEDILSVSGLFKSVKSEGPLNPINFTDLQ